MPSAGSTWPSTPSVLGRSPLVLAGIGEEHSYTEDTVQRFGARGRQVLVDGDVDVIRRAPGSVYAESEPDMDEAQTSVHRFDTSTGTFPNPPKGSSAISGRSIAWAASI
mgnify:CR=1 FL=1